ncbi:uncharacterized protein MYCFIDRAFT_173905 [Pseudocercospora fijiensis CIRAD86]|uniref:Uncharacterized protein n=1 Tax=Pseudocercospora fijiensis (strain CIRAD86) TaxID=383855 RepID=M2Z5E2_PSEFD|nr:uncharacterized protein MYCFIDRAFT_173905 [Pseudocercospora fijiensis CIRAD86]EME85035.1 hypothetical protein MYCFIDRAFT_173905 [Pseudocercospora fijiensis CIRAD86]
MLHRRNIEPGATHQTLTPSFFKSLCHSNIIIFKPALLLLYAELLGGFGRPGGGTLCIRGWTLLT